MTLREPSPLDNVRILEFPGVTDPARGTLTVLERLHIECQNAEGESTLVPFPIRRVFFIHGVPPEGRRGGHAHTSNNEILICVNGSLDITLTDGVREMHLHLDNPTQGLVVAADVWTRMENFSPGTVLLVLCSEEYREEGYLHDFEEFRQHIQRVYSIRPHQ